MLCIHRSTKRISLSLEKEFKKRVLVICEDSIKPLAREKNPTNMRRSLPTKLQIYRLRMSSYLVIHRPSLSNQGIRKQSKQAVPSTTNLLPQDHDPITKCILSSHLQSGQKASPVLCEGGLYGTGLRSFRKKTLILRDHYNS